MAFTLLLGLGLAAYTQAQSAQSSTTSSSGAASTFSLLPQSSTGGSDPHNIFDNYCNRVDSQSVVKGDSVWIDSGVQSFVPYYDNDPFTYNQTGNVTVGYNLYMLQIAVNTTWDWQKNLTTQETAWKKTAEPDTNEPAPQVVDAALYAGPSSKEDTRIWLYGGTTSYWNTSFPGFTGPQSADTSLWSFDTDSKVWKSHETPSLGSRPSLGYHAEARELGLGFYMGGLINSGSSSETQSFGDGKAVFLDGMVVLNFTGSKPSAKNISTSALGWPRAGGSAVYVPDFGQHGIVVFLGGGSKSTFNLDGNEQGSGAIPFSEVTVFDVGTLYGNNTNSTAWLRQTASGDIPSSRYRMCAAGASTADNSSYTIYMFGGRIDGAIYDQLYALSLPSFTWVRLWQGNSPRVGHTCHIVNNREFMTFGGAKEYDINQCDWEKRGVGIYDIPTANWTTLHTGRASSGRAGVYSLPQKIYSVIGGDASGSATKKDPDEGWSNPQLARLMGRSNSGNDGNGDPGNNLSGGLSGGAIAGVVIGVLAAVAIISAIAFVLIRRRRRSSLVAANDGTHNELPGGTSAGPGYGEKNAYEAEGSLVAEKEGSSGNGKVMPSARYAEAPGDHALEFPASESRTIPPQELYGDPVHR